MAPQELRKKLRDQLYHLNEFQTVARGEGRNCLINHSEAKRHEGTLKHLLLDSCAENVKILLRFM